MRVLLHDNQLCERGTTTSMLDYGRVLRQRGHEVEISYWSESPANVPEIVAQIEDEFALHPHAERDRLPAAASSFDTGYFIKAGDNDGLYLPNAHSLIHVVFENFDPHGSSYAYVSQWRAQNVRDLVYSRRGHELGLPERGAEAEENGCSNALAFDHLDHIVDIALPQPGMRKQLGIPEDAFVIMRFGAYDTFDIGWVKDVIVGQLDKHPNWYFLGLNTEQFTSHPRAVFVPRVMDQVEKASIVACGDVYLTARGQGEAFGIAIVEALQLGIPVLAWNGGVDRNHIVLLKDLGGLFTRPWDLRRKLRRIASGKDPASDTARRAVGDAFRPHRIAPQLEALLGLPA